MAGRIWPWQSLRAAALLLALSGCANFWDEVTSREFHVKDLWAKKPEPLEVIRTNTDGQRRGQALATLKEPAQNGGSKEDQDYYLKILDDAARQDREPYCRLCAIRALGGFKDPRAAQTLMEVYQPQTKLPFTLDLNNMIRLQALAALEKNGDEESRHLLIRVARQPSPSDVSDTPDRQQTQDEKLIALRALGKFKHPECVETLLYVAKTDKDVAVRDRAHDSLELVVGRKLPFEPNALQAAVYTPPPPPEPNFIQRVGGFLKPGQ